VGSTKLYLNGRQGRGNEDGSGSHLKTEFDHKHESRPLPWTFVLDHNSVASHNTLMLTTRFGGDRATLEGPGTDWEDTVSFEGHQE
jgi:hypothetical protein